MKQWNKAEIIEMNINDTAVTPWHVAAHDHDGNGIIDYDTDGQAWKRLGRPDNCPCGFSLSTGYTS